MSSDRSNESLLVLSTLPQNFFFFCLKYATCGLKKYTLSCLRTEMSTSFRSLLPNCPPRTGHPVPCFELGIKTSRRTLKDNQCIRKLGYCSSDRKRWEEDEKRNQIIFSFVNNSMFELIILEGIDSHHSPQTQNYCSTTESTYRSTYREYLTITHVHRHAKVGKFQLCLSSLIVWISVVFICRDSCDCSC